ncbi:MAG: thiamine phosphate synthase [Prevotella sp.]
MTDFRFIVITQPSFVSDEGMLINTLFENGIDRVHIRKPGASGEEHRRLIEKIDGRWHDRLSLHDCHDVAVEYGCGVHLNGRNPYPPQIEGGVVLSASCHSLAEVVERKPVCDYVFLSPIFDSISKQGYGSAFTEDDIKKATQSGIVDSRVMALGGVSLGNLNRVKAMGFGGAALLGEVWRNVTLFCRNLRQTLPGRTTAIP